MSSFIEPVDVGEPSVRVWKVDLSDDGPLDRLAGMLSADETQRASRFVFAEHRRRFVLARGALRMLLADQVAARPEDLQFAYGKYGRPELANPPCSALDFNLAHSGDWAVVAIATEQRVGIDVEQIRSGVDMLPIAQRHFSQAEYLDLKVLPAELRPKAFFRCWTSTEACLKALGYGLYGQRSQSPAGRWRIIEFEPAAGYVAAVALGAGEGALPKLEPEYRAQQSCTEGVGDDRPRAGTHGSPQLNALVEDSRNP